MWGKKIKQTFEYTGRFLMFTGGMIAKLILPGKNDGQFDTLGDSSENYLDSSVTTQEESNVIVLMSFPYDEWTRRVTPWLEDIALQEDTQSRNIRKFISSDIKRNDLAALLSEYSGKTMIKLFCGHGDFSAILGPPQRDDSDIKIGDTLHGVIYSYDMISPSPGALFAFCCRAARNFGRVFAAHKGKIFLGFDEDLPIVYDEEFLSRLKEIFTFTAQEILLEGNIRPEHEAQLKDGYANAMDYYEYGEGRKYKRNFLMKLYLEEHRGAIKRFGK